MSKNRNPYARAHSLRGGAGSGPHKDHRQDIIDGFTDPYSPEWMELCERPPPREHVDNDVKLQPSGSNPYPPLSREFLLARGYCCNGGCQNCPYNPPQPH